MATLSLVAALHRFLPSDSLTGSENVARLSTSYVACRVRIRDVSQSNPIVHLRTSP